MATDTEKQGFDRSTTEVRYSLRAMLIATAAVAVAATAIGVFIRTFPEDVHFQLAIYWGLLAAILVALYAFHASRRFHAERAAGRVDFRLTRHSYFLPNAPNLANYFWGLLLLCAGPGIGIVRSFAIAENGSVRAAFPNYGTIACLIASGYGITLLWWKRIQLCERGIIDRNDMIPWQNCQRWYWDACNKNVAVLVVEKGGNIAAKVPPDDREAVATLLHAKVGLNRQIGRAPT